MVDAPAVDYAALALQQAQDTLAKQYPNDKRPLLWRVRLEELND